MFSFSEISCGNRFQALALRLSTALVCCALLGSALAQTASGKAGPGAPPATQSQSAAGFSIESEMLTYRALESNSEAIACDVAAYLNGVTATFTSSSAGSLCSVAAANNGKTSVIVLPFDTGLIDGFQLWRTDMEIMHELRHRAVSYCPATPAKPQIEVGSKGVMADIAGATPAGGAIGVAQGVLGMLASQTDRTPVGGTIQDQAFMNGVARELRVLDVSVLMPTTYRPYSLNGIDETNSPFLANLIAFLGTRDCVIAAAKKNAADATLQGIDAEMNTFVQTLNGVVPASSKSNGPSTPATDSISVPTTGSSQSETPASSPLMAIMTADGLAQKLGIDPTSDKLPDHGEWQHILFIKALESGGSVTKVGNILGSKIWYSGGSVGTYALFSTDGELECSGNVFDFGGSVPAKKFQEQLRNYSPHPETQFVFQRGNCKVPPKP
jgi:hypothetical protein